MHRPPQHVRCNEGPNEMNATAQNTGSNVNPMTAIIDAAMRGVTTEGNRQAALTVAMFENEVTYNPKAIERIFKLEGADKSDAMDELLCDLSNEYETTLDKYVNLTDKDYRATLKGKPGAKEANVFEADALFRKIRAARKMMAQAMAATYHLHATKVKAIKQGKMGTGSLIVLMPNPEFPDRGDINVALSNNKAASEGDKALRAKTGKATKPASAKNPMASSLTDSSKQLATLLATAARKPLPDMELAPEVETNLEVTLRELFLRKFFDGATFDADTFKPWLASVSKFATPPKDENAKASNGVSVAKTSADKTKGDDKKSAA